MQPDFATMNETDVREIIVRPLLIRLGYAHGTQANIRTEVALRYERSFLGRKKATDPVLAGRADYICDATSYGRWAVEVKAPKHALTQDDVEQAHTYCAHPEIAAAYFLLTNGREFRLYATSQLTTPILAWSYEETEQRLMTIYNIVSYAAIRRLNEVTRPDVNKPLGTGLSSKLKIVGGQIKYGEHLSDHPLLKADPLKGMVGAVTGVRVERAVDGRLHATVSVLSPYQQLAELNKLAGIGDYEFFSSSEYVSVDRENPTIFQNVLEGRLEPGAKATIIASAPAIVLPIGFQFAVFTEATGYVSNDTFQGIVSFEYHYQFIRGKPSGIPQVDSICAAMPPTANLRGSGTFNIFLAPAHESKPSQL
jgi:Type I restriction enzyme R protein N terminus (HSDR_N)